MHDSLFDRERAVTGAGEGRWTAAISSAWNIGDTPNGGYLLATVISALQAHTGRPDPLSITAHFLRPGIAGAPAELATEVVRSGRRSTTATATLTQDGSERMRVLTAMGDAGDAAPLGLDLPDIDGPPPDVAPLVDCVNRTTLAQGVELPMARRVEAMVDPRWSVAGQGQRAEVGGWIRFADGREPDSAALVLFADAFPPPLFSLVGAIGWVPTLELTVHVRRPPAPGWILGHFQTTDLNGEMMIEDGQLWDSTGALVARSRQLAVLLSDGSQ